MISLSIGKSYVKNVVPLKLGNQGTNTFINDLSSETTHQNWHIKSLWVMSSSLCKETVLSTHGRRRKLFLGIVAHRHHNYSFSLRLDWPFGRTVESSYCVNWTADNSKAGGT